MERRRFIWRLHNSAMFVGIFFTPYCHECSNSSCGICGLFSLISCFIVSHKTGMVQLIPLQSSTEGNALTSKEMISFFISDYCLCHRDICSCDVTD